MRLRYLLLFGAILLLGSLGCATPQETLAGPPPYAVVKVFYGTDRNRTSSEDPDEIYGPARGNGSIELGQCEVSIPRDHRMGEIERPSVWHFEFRENPSKHVVVLKVRRQTKSDFYAELRSRIVQSERKQAFVFVHGYNVPFVEATRRTAQMAYDLGFDGAPLLYSWPSEGSVSKYPTDEANVEWSTSNLKAFLSDISASGADTVHLIAHSMGCRALTRAIVALSNELTESSKTVFREMVLAAPDIDADVFRRDIAPRIVEAKIDLTLYASSEDKALKLSKGFHGYKRAGQSGDDIVILPGMDTVDATGVKTGFLGHSYHAENDSVLSDIFYLLRGDPPSERHGLRPVSHANGDYWKFHNR